MTFNHSMYSQPIVLFIVKQKDLALSHIDMRVEKFEIAHFHPQSFAFSIDWPKQAIVEQTHQRLARAARIRNRIE